MKRVLKNVLPFMFCALLVFGAITPLLGTNSTSAYANSAQSKWSGVTSSGVIVKDENCPLEVLNENLTFDLQEFPNCYYG